MKRKKFGSSHIGGWRSALIFTSGSVAIIAVIATAGYYNYSSLKEANASNLSGLDAEIILNHDSTNDVTLITPAASGLTQMPMSDESEVTYTPHEVAITAPLLRGGELLPSYYNSHDFYSTYTRTKNQNTEGLCWAYALSTTLEYTLEKAGHATTVSPKHFDYQNVSADKAYKSADVTAGLTNSAYDHFAEYMRAVLDPSYDRLLGDGTNQNGIQAAVSNPLAIQSEEDFTATIKSNDSSLASISKYEDIWGLSNYESLLTEMDDGSNVYTVKQDYGKINNEGKTDYVVTDLTQIFYPYYGESETKSEIVTEIKKAVKNYGAVVVASTFDTEKCMSYYTENNNIYITITDYGWVSGYGWYCDGGHAMTIIGWDDDWEYTDAFGTKTGAFIIQNSYGETMPVQTTGEIVNMPAYYYIGYDSELCVLYFNNIDELSAYDNLYGIEDYKGSTITPAADEYIFEFTSTGPEGLDALTFDEGYYNDGIYDPDVAYDVYVSTTGRSSDFKKVGQFQAKYGMTKYEFSAINHDTVFNGDYAIKLKRKDGATIDSAVRKRNTINVYTEDVTLEDLIVTFDSNGGKGTIETVSCQSINGASCQVNIPATKPTLTEMKFLGWADSADATTATKQPGDTMTLTQSTTLYAVWTDDGEVTWKEGEIYIKDKNMDLVVKINYPLSKFRSVEIDGKELKEDEFKAESGSTIITVYGKVIDKLDSGKHTLLARFDGVEVEEVQANFMVYNEEEFPVPDTGTPDTGMNTRQDSRAFNSDIVIGIVSSLSIVSLIVYIASRIVSKSRF